MSDSADIRPVKRLLLAQALVVVAVGVVGYGQGRTVAESMVFGGLVAWVATLYFARQAFRHAGGASPALAARGFYVGLAGKLVIVAVGFWLIFRLRHPVSPGGVFAGFAIVQFVTWLAPFWIDRR